MTSSSDVTVKMKYYGGRGGEDWRLINRMNIQTDGCLDWSVNYTRLMSVN